MIAQYPVPRSGVAARAAATAVSVAVVTLIALAGCTGGDGTPPPTKTPTPTASAEAAPGITDITDTPGSGESLVGALSDSTTTECARKGDAWTVSGTVTNPTDADADYRIYVSLLTGTSDTRSLTQVDVDAVAPAQTADWTTDVPVPEDGLSCVLRVERYVTASSDDESGDDGGDDDDG